MKKRIIRFLGNNNLMKIPRKIVEKVIIALLSIKNGVIIYYYGPEQNKVIDLIREIKKETEVLMSINDLYNIYSAVERTKKIKGDIAEVGVYKGGSAKVICEAKGDKVLHLVDTFSGLPKLEKIDAEDILKEGQFKVSINEAKTLLRKYDKVLYHKGLFPSTGKAVKNKTFSFIQLDADLYKSTLDCLTFFYPRLNKGGIIMSHDYTLAGVRKAFDDFFRYKSEPIIEIPHNQCLIVKTESKE